MAFEKIAGLQSPITALPDRVTGEAAWLKQYFDNNPTQLMQAHNHLVDALSAADAAGQIGFTPTDGVDAQTVQAAIELLKDMIDAAATGAIPDGSLTGAKLQDGAVGEEKLTQDAQDKLNGAHTHGNMTALGAIGASSGKVIVTGTGGVMEAVTQNSAFNRAFYAGTPSDLNAEPSAGVSSSVARGDHSHKSERFVRKYELDAVLQDNTRYILRGSGAITLNYPDGEFECSVFVAFRNSANITFPAATQYLGSVPRILPNNAYEISIVDGIAVVSQAGDGS